MSQHGPLCARLRAVECSCPENRCSRRREAPRLGSKELTGYASAGMFAAQGLLAALYQRDALGGQEGQVVDVSILESCFALMESAASDYDLTGTVRQPTGTRIPGHAPSNVFRSADNQLVVIAANTDRLFGRLCDVMGRSELADDPRYSSHRARHENQDFLEREIQAWAGRHSAEAIDHMLAGAGVVCGPIYSIADIFSDPHVRAREMLVEHNDDELGRFLGPGVVPKFSATPGSIRWSGRWEAGAHNQEIYGQLLQRSQAELDQLHSEGVI